MNRRDVKKWAQKQYRQQSEPLPLRWRLALLIGVAVFVLLVIINQAG